MSRTDHHPAQGYAAYLTRLWALRDTHQYRQPPDLEGLTPGEFWRRQLHHSLMEAPDRIRRAQARSCALRGCPHPTPVPSRHDHGRCASLFGQLHHRLWSIEVPQLRDVLQDDEYRPLYEFALDGLCLLHGVALAVRFDGTVGAVVLRGGDLRFGWCEVTVGRYLAVILGPCGGVLAAEEVEGMEAVQLWAETAQLGGCGHPDPGPLCRPDGA